MRVRSGGRGENTEKAKTIVSIVYLLFFSST
jgi:hypothetical protein